MTPIDFDRSLFPRIAALWPEDAAGWTDAEIAVLRSAMDRVPLSAALDAAARLREQYRRAPTPAQLRDAAAAVRRERQAPAFRIDPESVASGDVRRRCMDRLRAAIWGHDRAGGAA